MGLTTAWPACQVGDKQPPYGKGLLTAIFFLPLLLINMGV